MRSVAKLGKRLCLVFSGSQSALQGFGCRVFDLRKSGLPPLLPLSAHALRHRVVAGEGRIICVYIVDDIHAEGWDVSGVIMTDGAGLISSNLAEMLPSVSEGNLVEEVPVGAPLGTQMRAYPHGMLAKGMLMTSHSLPPNVILLTNSQVKVERADGRSTGPELEGSFSLEVLDSTRAHEPRLNAQLIPILEAASGEAGSEGRRRFHDLMQRLATEEAEKVLQLKQPNASREKLLETALRHAQRKAACGTASQFGCGTPSVSEMLEAGLGVLHEPYLLDQCQKAIKGTLERARKGKLRLGSSSHRLKGFPSVDASRTPGHGVREEGS